MASREPARLSFEAKQTRAASQDRMRARTPLGGGRSDLPKASITIVRVRLHHGFRDWFRYGIDPASLRCWPPIELARCDSPLRAPLGSRSLLGVGGGQSFGKAAAYRRDSRATAGRNRARWGASRGEIRRGASRRRGRWICQKTKKARQKPGCGADRCGSYRPASTP